MMGIAVRVGYMVMGALMFFIFTSAHAGVLRGNQENCSHLARVVRDVANLRDVGVRWEEYSPELEQSIAEAIGKPTSIISDEADANYVRATIKALWDHKGVSAQNEGVNTLVACMKKTA